MKATPSLYAPAERASDTTIRNQVKSIFNLDYLQKLYDAVSEIIVILNKERQIVFCNQQLLDTLNIQNKESVYGLRPGEVLNCSHAFETESGCGTTEFCRECGAINAILSCQKGEADAQECRIIQKNTSDALDIIVKTTPLVIGEDQYVIAALSDISHLKRRRILERIFFHDIMNTAVGVRGLSELFTMASKEQLEELRNMIHSGAEKLVEEIRSQKELTYAENNELTSNPTTIDTFIFLKSIVGLYREHEVAKGKHIQMDPAIERTEFKSDETILSRVIGNMAKNALEACTPGDTVTLGCRKENAEIQFWIHNPTYIPRNVQLQIFQRSFSTKGAGRGLGTYSMKLLSERYLKGSVSFTSSEQKGTEFIAKYPLVL